jgi:hypothetical protein
MMGCKGLHCEGCGGRGGGGLVGLVVVLAIAAALYHVRRGIETGAEIAVWTVLGVACAAAVAGITYGTLRIRARIQSRQNGPGRPNSLAWISRAPREPLEPPRAVQALPPPQQHVHFHFHGGTGHAAEVARQISERRTS